MSGFKVIFEGQNLVRLLGGLWVAIKISAISLLIGLPLGYLFGLLRTLGIKWLNVIFKIYLEIVRILPLLVLLYLFYYTLPQAGSVVLSNFAVSVIVFVIWVAAETSDLVYSSISAVPKSQVENGRALGFSRRQIYQYILMPQSFRSLIAPSVNLITRVIKTTSILLMIGVEEVIRVGTQIIENYSLEVPTAAFWIYGFIFLLYFVICFPISRLSKHIEAKLKEEK